MKGRWGGEEGTEIGSLEVSIFFLSFLKRGHIGSGCPTMYCTSLVGFTSTNALETETSLRVFVFLKIVVMCAVGICGLLFVCRCNKANLIDILV